MMDDERLTVFLNSLEEELPSFLAQMEREARLNHVPIIRPQTRSLLRMLLAAGRPSTVLEVGTAVGFSALCMKEYAPKDCRIVTIERQEDRITAARENFRRFDQSGRITLLAGDAAGILQELQGPFDFIFMDAAKGQYLHFLPEAFRLLTPGGMLVSDNVLQEGDILESRYAVRRRDRTIHSRMREYLYEIKHHPGLVTSILPVGDGVAVSVKRD